jgi:predicted RNA-binding protein with TRAM domain
MPVYFYSFRKLNQHIDLALRQQTMRTSFGGQPKNSGGDTMVRYEENKEYKFEISHITGDGSGLAWGENGELVLIEGVNENDKVVRASIRRVLQESIIATKAGIVKKDSGQINVPGAVENPYQIDETDDEDYNNDDTEEEAEIEDDDDN